MPRAITFRSCSPPAAPRSPRPGMMPRATGRSIGARNPSTRAAWCANSPNGITNLRSGQPVAAIVDRVLDIAMSEPRGPVYLTLPREVLSDAATTRRRGEERPLGAMAAVPSQEAIDAAADLLAGAQFPLILTSALGRSPEAFAAFAELTEEFALPVAQGEPNDLNLPSNHPMNLGFDVKSLLPRADVVLVLDA